jgi:type III restriction enzyme
MGNTANYVAQRLSLRKPQKESLELLEKIVKTVGLDPKESVESRLAKASSLQLPKFSEFERDFPSFSFALATGVGKTRLMGASISYLFLEHGIRDFLVLAPNLTIYNKLIEDFSNPSNPKYVFRGIGEFVHSPPKIITGDNYANVNTQRKVYTSTIQGTLFGEEVSVNIFNISKINSETRGGSSPRIKRLSEYLGESYFQYLQNIDRLVLLMDEAHQYRAERGFAVINELKPVLGLEFTATAKTKQGTKTEPFKNIVYDYSLAKAIADGFVKEPAVATRRNLTKASLNAMSDVEKDQLKLKDAAWVHENTKTKLLKFAKDNNRPIVKPFILVVAKNTEHASEIEQYIKSQDFYNGQYANNVITVHSNLRGEEKDENIELLLSLEKTDNPIEIVIHVNMLKEGWDVTNLYTLVPLRAFAADILTEQTLGRGLRLPYGEKTGDADVDKLTVIAHDRFDELIQAAQSESSIILKQEIIDVSELTTNIKQEVVTVTTPVEAQVQAEEAAAAQITDEEKRNQAMLEAKVKRIMLDGMAADSPQHNGINPMAPKAEQTKQIKQFVEENLPLFSVGGISEGDIKKTAIAVAEQFVKEIEKHSIAIPRITIQPKDGSVKVGFKKFSLKTQGLPRFNPIHDEILIRDLQKQKDTVIGLVDQRNLKDSNEKLIIAKIIDHDEVDYEANQELLYALAKEMLDYLKTYLKSEDDISNVVLTQRDQIAEQIWAQMQDHFFCEVTEYDEPKVLPFTALEPHNYSKVQGAAPTDYKAKLDTIAELRKTIFTGFKKACHPEYKFDSFNEQKFAQILEADSDKNVLKWLRPAPRQFYIYWDHHTRTYEPDFIVETGDGIWMVEIKAKIEIEAADTQEKKKAALEYCRHATDYNSKNSGKPWSYLLIPDEEVALSRNFDYYCKTYLQEGAS